jgi:hypothetical protein
MAVIARISKAPRTTPARFAPPDDGCHDVWMMRFVTDSDRGCVHSLRPQALWCWSSRGSDARCRRIVVCKSGRGNYASHYGDV